ncbi:MAG: TonB family protein [Thermodesulfobacteriota bacterium]|nr:TonB family protein [Thermodesulfobacteriota bacterium]
MIWIVSAAVAFCFAGAGVFIIKLLLSDDSQKRKRQVQMVALLKPPPPKIKEKPPEPEIKKKEEIIEPEPEETPPEDMEDTGEEDMPEGDELGLDAEGSSGSDNFGLKGKKGGRALIGGGLSEKSLIRKYSWYIRLIQDEIRKTVKTYLEQNGGIPEGNLKTLVKIILDETGNIVDFSIFGSSGNHRMDNAVKEALKMARVNDPPPKRMPKVIELKITSKG